MACPFSVTSRQAVCEALTHRDLGVRPAHEPVPPALLATPAHPIFASLVRMRDDGVQPELKAAIGAALDSFSEDDIRQTTIKVAQQLATRLSTAEQLTRFNYSLPICLLAEMLGVAVRQRDALVDEVMDFVRCIAPGGSTQQMISGAQAAGKLQIRMQQADGPLFLRLSLQIGDRSLAEANAIGLFFQACEGTAGLLGQTLLLMSHRSESAEYLISEVLRQTPPIHTTRRFALRDTQLDGQALVKGQCVTIPLKTAEESFAFGYGVHQCPGSHWAKTIALAGIDYLSALNFDPSLLSYFRWRISQNAHVPEFYTAKEHNNDCGDF
ncbi:cytochrome P450 [Serratia aquatilis]|uniref:Cytochrome P450 n=1 Tax=Serratia aquatilis TaxID=1737515 RepID=A0ABV6EK17_9GAMM